MPRPVAALRRRPRRLAPRELPPLVEAVEAATATSRSPPSRAGWAAASASRSGFARWAIERARGFEAQRADLRPAGDARRRAAGGAAVRARLRHGDRDDRRRRAGRLPARGGRARPRAPGHRAHLGGFLHRGRQLRDFAPRLRSPRRIACAAVILAIDQGTTGHAPASSSTTRARIAGRAYREFAQHFPRPGWVEHDAERDLGGDAGGSADEALDDAGIDGADLDAIGITNQRETVVAWDPAHRRAASTARSSGRTGAPPRRCDELREAGHETLVRERTGLVHRPLLLRHEDRVAAARTSTAPSDAGFGTIDSWLVFKLTGAHVTDYSNASRTMLFDIRELRWDAELCELLGVDSGPAARAACRSARGLRDHARSSAASVPVAGHRRRPAGGAVRPGLPSRRASPRTPTARAASSCSTRAPRRRSPARACSTTVAWGLGGRARPTRSRRRSSSPAPPCSGCATASGIIDEAAETEELAASLDGNDGVYFVPALTGLGSPYWDPYARGTIVGLTRGHRPRAPRPRRARGDRLPDGRRGPGAGGGRRASARASCGPTAARSSTAG